MPSLPSLNGLKPYRIDIQQGNYLSQEMVSQLKKGMTKDQVRFVLGTPLVTDIFHADRWDYVFYRELGSGKKEQRNISVFFEQDRLARVAGDVTAAPPTTGAASPAPGKPGASKDEAPQEGAPKQDAPKPAADGAPAKTEAKN
ncbi:MAG: outer membrane protein assembly factor BamE [Proteobacteria bacterium]|nr:outer membrane protein assembly factor BamE [Pseudomonadota bacterium]